MGSTIKASDADACATRSYEVQQLAGRVGTCSDRLDSLLRRFWQVQMIEWQSPAGTAYRNSVGLQAAAVRRAREQLDFATSAVLRHAQAVSATSGRTAGGGY
ncbi:hypothetical protein V3C33_18110 [Micrococcaceae bacterium Sec5.7]